MRLQYSLLLLLFFTVLNVSGAETKMKSIDTELPPCGKNDTVNSKTIGTTIPVIKAGKNASNAHWQVVAGEAACVVDGGSEYYTDDDTWMYRGPFNLSSYLDGELEFHYSLDVADGNDVLSVYAVDSEPTDSSVLTSPLATYNSNESGTTVTLDVGTEETTYIVFRWQSDGSGVAGGPRLDNIALNRYWWDSGTEVYTQTTDTYSPYTRSVDISAPSTGETISIGWWYFDGDDGYTTHGDGWYWAIDDIEVYDENRTILFSEDFEGGDPGWDQYIRGGTGEWELYDTGTYNITGMTNNYYAANDYYYGWAVDFDVEAYAAPIDCTGSTTVTVDWAHNFQDYAGDGIIWLIIWKLIPYLQFNENCDDLGDWTTVDEGTGVGIESSSLGNIKALYK